MALLDKVWKLFAAIIAFVIFFAGRGFGMWENERRNKIEKSQKVDYVAKGCYKSINSISRMELNLKAQLQFLRAQKKEFEGVIG
jgi:hypothetical protein